MIAIAIQEPPVFEPIRMRSKHVPSPRRHYTLCRMTHEEFGIIWRWLRFDRESCRILNYIPVPPNDLFLCMGAKTPEEVERLKMETFIRANGIELVDGDLLEARK